MNCIYTLAWYVHSCRNTSLINNAHIHNELGLPGFLATLSLLLNNPNTSPYSWHSLHCECKGYLNGLPGATVTTAVHGPSSFHGFALASLPLENQLLFRSKLKSKKQLIKWLGKGHAQMSSWKNLKQSPLSWFVPIVLGHSSHQVFPKPVDSKSFGWGLDVNFYARYDYGTSMAYWHTIGVHHHLCLAVNV